MLKPSDNPPSISEGIKRLTDLPGDWWVAQTKARAEKKLAWDFTSLAIAYFLPMTEKTALWGGRKRKVMNPIFPGYLFFAGREQDRYRAVTNSHVCQILPVRQRDRFVAELEAIRQAIANRNQLDLYPFTAVGERCRVRRGPLEGIEGIVIRKDDVIHLVLQVSMLGQGASLEITADLLEPA